MAEAKIYNQKGGVVGKINLPVKVFAAKWRPDLVHQVVESMRSNKRAGTADAKDRGEVRGGGKNLGNKRERAELGMVPAGVPSGLAEVSLMVRWPRKITREKSQKKCARKRSSRFFQKN